MRKLLCLLGLVALTGCASMESRKPVPPLAWNFQVKRMGEFPKGQVFLKVDGKDYLVVQDATTNYQQLQRGEYKDYRIPAKALLASYSWWAGYGDILYVVRKGDRLEVYQQEMDEAEDSSYPVKRVKVIPF